MSIHKDYTTKIVLLLTCFFAWHQITAQEKINVYSFFKAYSGVDKSTGQKVASYIKKQFPDDKYQHVSGKEVIPIIKKHYPKFDPLKSQITEVGQKDLHKKLDFIIFSGLAYSAKNKRFTAFFRVISLHSKINEEKKRWAAKNLKQVGQGFKKYLGETSIFKYKKQKTPVEVPVEVPVVGWFSEKMPKNINRSKIPGIYINARDNSWMVYVTGGEFTDQQGNTINVDGYYIDKYEVTNRQFCNFLNALQKNQDETGNLFLDLESPQCCITLQEGKYSPKKNMDNFPVVKVTWHGAMAYCKWAGKSLPEKAQWQKAYRGGQKIPQWGTIPLKEARNPQPDRMYPWGNLAPNERLFRCNYKQPQSNEDGYAWLAPTNAFDGIGDSPYGCSNMLGNVWEWCADIEDEKKLCLGGSWGSDSETLASKSVYSLQPNVANNDLGFRGIIAAK